MLLALVLYHPFVAFMLNSKILITLVGLCCGTLAWAQAEETENVTARYQVTYNGQRHPSFRSEASGLNSLTAAADQMFTFSATAHWGIIFPSIIYLSNLNLLRSKFCNVLRCFWYEE